MQYRFAAMLYDVILLVAIYFFSTLVILPFNHGQAISPGNLPYLCYLYSLTYFYFTWQWNQGGQTLGMRAWKIRLISDPAAPVSFTAATNRFLVATFSLLAAGAGFFWALLDRDNLALHDRLSGTRLILTD